MKLIVLTLLLVSLAMTKPIFVNKNDVGGDTFKSIIAGFLEGFEFSKYATPDETCQGTVDSFTGQIQEGLEQVAHGHIYNGTLELTGAFNHISQMSRDCYPVAHNASMNFTTYQASFKNIADFFDKVSVNTMRNLKYIKKDFGFMLANYLSSPNFTYISGLAGEITKYTFVLEEEDPFMVLHSPLTPLTYQYADPLASTPMSEGLWTVLEGAFKFLLSSKFASLEATQDCQEGSINFVYFHQHAYHFNARGKTKDAYFTLADGLGFSNQAFQGCSTMFSEFGTTFKNIINNGHIGDNIKSNLASIISGGMGTWSQIYHQDWTNLLHVLGDLTYRIFVYGSN